MPETVPSRELEIARRYVYDFVTSYAELALWDDTPIQSATNQVFYGALRGEPIVFKHFVRKARKWQEECALQWLATSGVVPRLYHYLSEDILVMQRLAGQMLWQTQQSLSAAALAGIYRQVGAGLARLVTYASNPDDGDHWHNPYAPDDRFWSTSFDEFFDDTLETCRHALARHQIHQPKLHAAIANLQAVRSEVLAFPIFMHVDDIHGANMMVDGDRFQGFIDFEMSRMGNELYLLGATLQWACLDNRVQWPLIRAGYEEERGPAHSREIWALVRLFAPFQNLCRFAWRWGTDELPEWVWRDNVREKILRQLVQTLDSVDEVMGRDSHE